MEIGLPKPFSFPIPLSKFSKRILFTKSYNKTNQETYFFSNQRRFKNLFCDKTLDDNNKAKNYNWRRFPSLSWRVSLKNYFSLVLLINFPISWFARSLVRFDTTKIRSSRNFLDGPEIVISGFIRTGWNKFYNTVHHKRLNDLLILFINVTRKKIIGGIERLAKSHPFKSRNYGCDYCFNSSQETKLSSLTDRF